jgi:glucose/arabinose dehydrogenase
VPVSGSSRSLRVALAVVLVGAAGLAGCSNTGTASSAPTPSGRAPSGGTKQVEVDVPEGLRAAPFDQPRTLTVPTGFAISVYARLAGARFMTLTPDGAGLLVSRPGTGTVALIRPDRDGTGTATDFLTGLTKPHDLVFDTIDGRTWLYVSESNRIVRYPWAPGDQRAQQGQVVVAGLPDASTPELRGKYSHALKNIALGPDHTLYVSVASTCNVCASDATSDPPRAAIFTYSADGKNRRLFATGIRNAEGLAFPPGSNRLWAVVNNRDNLAVAEHKDVDSDGTDDYGRVIPSYVNDHPPEEFLQPSSGDFFGWPYCNPTPDSPSKLRDMPFLRDVETNADGAVDCARAKPVAQGIQAHSAPLGLTFTGSAGPESLRGGALVALHGSWNRTSPTGYAVVFFPWQNDRPGDRVDVVSGWTGDKPGSSWGKPVDTVVDRDGSILVSDDQSGTIYRLAKS